jgi:hypothetical protein
MDEMVKRQDLRCNISIPIPRFVHLTIELLIVLNALDISVNADRCREPPGIGDSDHGSFGHEGHPAIMLTGTAPFRFPHYHKATDTIDKIDFHRVAPVVRGLD